MLFTAVLAFSALQLYPNPNYVPDQTPVAEPLKQDCHYADPYQQSCKNDEIAAEIVAKPTNLKVCTTVCKQDSDCPTDTCPGVNPKPKCFLQDLHGSKYCGLPCHVNSTGTRCSFDEHMVCEQEPGRTVRTAV